MPDPNDPGHSPKYSGLLQNNDKNPKTRKTLGRVFLWEARQQSQNSPAFYGRLHTRYGQSSLVLWPHKKRSKAGDGSEFRQI